ncbi:MarR family transcriptional regulator [Rhizobium sp. P40RR-XXII]|uniref:MarR family winged helix-turn-helix transcriptional regulator n=1 Tax=unclassified Rhizobium TaxID=2613769 RepID=UPI0014572C67|nr:MULTISPECIES: MarR family transcriptional regulator [unclassified Rhizobium]NLR89527.1 MarR family transcriptional regulator [Rhizobium sp. P28RR-XV]NLS20716.1 MarR family transcriptional regulator [Rhizobium sp. P40RR-XXII]
MQLLNANKLGALGTLIRDRTDAALGEFSPSAASVLSMLHFKPGLTTSKLAAIIGISQPTAVRLIDGLERQALIERGLPEGRVTPLRLTEEGQAEAKALQARRLAALDGLLGSLQPDERQAFTSLLDVVLSGATTSRAFARTTCRLCEHNLCGPEICPIGCRAAAIEAGKNTP